MSNIYQRAAGAARYIKQKIDDVGELCIVTGSGLDTVLENYEIIESIPYSHIPHLSEATFHRGRFMVLRSKNGTRLCALNGRLHFYEGYTAEQVAFPIRILSLLGVKTLIMTNAAGGLNPDYFASEIVMVRDHINLLPDNPLRGKNVEEFGPRFPDMSNAYDKGLRDKVLALSAKNNFPLREGVYACFQGPSLETPAEYKFLHSIGGELVGMSTVPEVIAANHCGMKVLVLSVVTNVCIPIENIKPTTVESVLAVANSASKALADLINQIVTEALYK